MKKSSSRSSLKISKNPKFVKAIEKILKQRPYTEYINKLVYDIFKNHTLYLWSGAVRDAIIETLYGPVKIENDLDFLIDDSMGKVDFKNLLKDLPNITHTRFGSPKWKPDKRVEIDIVPFSNAPLVKIGGLAISLETMLKSSDITTSSIAYGIDNKIIYSFKALEDIRRKRIDVLCIKDQNKAAVMARIVLHADKLNFEIGQKTVIFIKQYYSPKQDKEIFNWLRYKKIERLFGFVIENLREIKGG